MMFFGLGRMTGTQRRKTCISQSSAPQVWFSRKLTQRLVKDGSLGGKPIEKFTLIDVFQPEAPAGFSGAVDARAADLSAPGEAEKLVDARPDAIFHLAAIVSGEAELDFDKGYRINLDGTRYLFDAIRIANGKDGYKPRVVSPRRLPSSARRFLSDPG